MINYGTKYSSVHFWIDNGETWARLIERLGGVSGVILRNSLNHHPWNFIALSYDYVTGVQRVWIDGKVYDAANVGQFGLKTQDVIRMGVKDGDPRVLKGRI